MCAFTPKDHNSTLYHLAPPLIFLSSFSVRPNGISLNDLSVNKTLESKSGFWNFTELFSIYRKCFGLLSGYLFKDSTSRKAEFTEITNSDEIPKNFCASRSVENIGPANTFIEVSSILLKYLKEAKPKTKRNQFLFSVGKS